ncbi:bifunctional pyr operon transcriptional regulator/uracil phosphoribosyltransferase PyrR [bacterium]|nr:MAG: bifunctional pyr operon transcriptional regulator/uracil phosphoribosyltransferase PyrR [bacterium]
MTWKKKEKIMDPEGMNWTLRRIANEIIENCGVENLCLIGIRKRGDVLAERLSRIIKEITGKEIPVGVLDITLYRDDLTIMGPRPLIGGSEIPCKIDGMKVVLVDDVIYTGRTVRAALDELVDYGRPSFIKLAVLIDRGGRELPIHPDFVGKKIELTGKKQVQVEVKEVDGEDGIWIMEEEV